MLEYDYIILGTGASGLSLAMRMIDSKELSGKKILLIDKTKKTTNDKTWCFWEERDGYFESIVYKKWNCLAFYGETKQKDLDIDPYSYKMIRSIDFYNYCFERIEQAGNVDVMYGEIRSVLCDERSTTIHFNDQQLVCGPAVIFNSLYRAPVIQSHLQLLQHFKGWVIETADPHFDENKALLMDFRVHQDRGTTFAYVLPSSPTIALVEYTLFTESTLGSHEYDEELRNYISSILNIEKYSIRETEFGIIPMTSANFNFFDNGMYNIGTAGGQTKASTGYTFQFIQKQSVLIVECLNKRKSLSTLSATSGRFHFYDKVLLQLLVTKQLGGREIFARLFEKNKASRIFRFLDNETSVIEELSLIYSLQTLPFLKAALQMSLK